jgi:hypothetical protein
LCDGVIGTRPQSFRLNFSSSHVWFPDFDPNRWSNSLACQQHLGAIREDSSVDLYQRIQQIIMLHTILVSLGTSPLSGDLPSWLLLSLWWLAYRLTKSTLIFVWGEERFRAISRYCFLANVEEHIANQLCPKRRARFLKCSKRCQQQARRKKTCRQANNGDKSVCCQDQCDKLCELGKALMKLHLPPPLPFFKKRKAKQQQSSCCNVASSCPNGCSCCQCVAEEDSSSSSQTTCTSDEILTKTFTADHVSLSVSPLPPKTPRSLSSSLIDMARMQQWTSILTHVTRKGAKYCDADGLYPLHWACSGSPPLQVVQALLDVYPSASHKTDLEGSTPLHFATHYAAPIAVMELLLQAYPRAIKMQDKYGRTPLYHAVEKSLSIDVIKLLVQAELSCVILPCLPKTKRSLAVSRETAVRTPLYMAWASVLKDRHT